MDVADADPRRDQSFEGAGFPGREPDHGRLPLGDPQDAAERVPVGHYQVRGVEQDLRQRVGGGQEGVKR
eukprot:852469-Prorocentrum_minimum.AAC.3